MTKDEQTQIEAAAFRGLIAHLQERKDVQNIDLMNLAGFCRNCLSKWYLQGAKDLKVDLDYDQACETVYGMSYADWKANHQTKATTEQIETFEKTKPIHAKISGHN
ncbi:MAG: DUF1244 domain-containing protein [Thiotrichaceae bacterium]|nr:DUF1244 domain-containing protein [Thiotrichaceae bacterium]